MFWTGRDIENGPELIILSHAARKCKKELIGLAHILFCAVLARGNRGWAGVASFIVAVAGGIFCVGLVQLF